MNESRMKGRGAAAGHRPRINDHGTTAALRRAPMPSWRRQAPHPRSARAPKRCFRPLLFLLLFRSLPCAPQAPRLSVRLKKTRRAFKRRRRDETGSSPHQTSEPAVDVLGHRNEHVGHGRRLPEGRSGGLRPDEDESRPAAGHHVESGIDANPESPGTSPSACATSSAVSCATGTRHGADFRRAPTAKASAARSRAEAFFADVSR